MRSSTERSMPTSFGNHSSRSSFEVSSMKSVAASGPSRGWRVVDVELGLDGLVGEHALGPRHLLDLEADRVAVLEHEGDERADTDPELRLCGRPCPRATERRPAIVVDGELHASHSRADPLMSASSVRFARCSRSGRRAMSWIGCTGCFPVSCTMLVFASAQSPATTSARLGSRRPSRAWIS